MVGLLIAGIVVIAAGYLIGKKCYAPAVFFFAGGIMLAVAHLLGMKPLLDPKLSMNIFVFDLFDVIRRAFSGRMPNLGLVIMSIAGFSKLMDHIKASDALFAVVSAPLRRIENPYILLMASFWVIQFLSIFIPSAAGLSVLLMVTIYPILVRKGVSRLSALAIIGTARTLTIGPASPNMIFGSNLLKMDVGTYFIEYQLPLLGPLLLILFVSEFFTQRFWDKKEGPDLEGINALEGLKEYDGSTMPPRFYALLPLLPLVLIVVCSPIVTSYFSLPKIKLDVATAMFMSIFISVSIEMVRKLSVGPVLASMKPLFEQMGKTFGLVIVLIIAAEVFAKGIMNLGAISTMVDAAKSAGFGIKVLTVCACLIVFGSAFLMGSGNAAFFAFAALVPDVAATFAIPGIFIMMPIDFMSAFGRTMSPVFGATVATSGMAGTSPFTLAKRQAIPCLLLMIFCPILTFLIL